MWLLPTLLTLVLGITAQAAECEESAELRAIFAADQGDRETERIDWERVAPRDRERREEVAQILDNVAAPCPADLYRAAMVYQHGHSPQHFLLAHVLATAAAFTGHSPARRLAASTLDRYLHRIGQPQVLGTQLRRDPGERDFSPEPYAREVVPGSVRELFDMASHREQEARLKAMNAQAGE